MGYRISWACIGPSRQSRHLASPWVPHCNYGLGITQLEQDSPPDERSPARANVTQTLCSNSVIEMLAAKKRQSRGSRRLSEIRSAERDPRSPRRDAEALSNRAREPACIAARDVPYDNAPAPIAESNEAVAGSHRGLVGRLRRGPSGHDALPAVRDGDDSSVHEERQTECGFEGVRGGGRSRRARGGRGRPCAGVARRRPGARNGGNSNQAPCDVSAASAPHISRLSADGT